MTRLEYLEQYHSTSQSLIGLVSISTNLEQVRSHLDMYRPMLDDIHRERVVTYMRIETGCDESTINAALEMMGYR